MHELAPLGRELLHLSLTQWAHRAHVHQARQFPAADPADRARVPAPASWRDLLAGATDAVNDDGLAHLVTHFWRVDHLILSDAGVSAIRDAFTSSRPGAAQRDVVVPVDACAGVAAALVGAVYLAQGLPAAHRFASTHVLQPRLEAAAAAEV